MNFQKTITLAVNCDNDYMLLLAALLKSIEINHHSGENIVLYMVGDGITAKSKAKIHNSINNNMIRINWLDMSQAIPPGVKLPLESNLYPPSIYMRLFVPDFVPEEIEKVLYLDVDMIVLEDISLLYNIDINEYDFGAVIDPRVRTIDNDWGGVLNYRELGLDGKNPYINSGLYLINTRKWREANIAQRIIQAINNNRKYAEFAEQYAMNTILHTLNWLKLDAKWNHFSCEDSTEKPGIIHFISRKPFHATYAGKPHYKDLFYSYLNLTEWKDTGMVMEPERYLKKIKILLGKWQRLAFAKMSL